MKTSRFSEEQKVRISGEIRAGKSHKDIREERNISSQSNSLRNRKDSEMDINEARKLRVLEDKNSRIKLIIAYQVVQIYNLKEIASKKGALQTLNTSIS